MSENARDTQFKGFAELLYQELSELEGSDETLISEYRNKYDKQDIIRLIAQRAYDLARHILKIAPITEYEWGIDEVPDMTEWPETDG